jgi:DNA helicase IV
MASDLRQSIYGVTSPFVRAGIHISGRTRVLRTNFRNTRQIAETALRFHETAAEPTYAFRDGPDPELHMATTGEDLLPLLLAKLQLFTDRLEYEPDNISVLAPHKAEVDRLLVALREAGFQASAMIAPEFAFDQAGAVRVSTLHSSKGLDFPVVMLYLPYIHRREKFDAETTERLVRNLIYVGLTRAMENLSVFVSPGSDPVLQDLVAAIRADASAPAELHDAPDQ